MKSKSYKIGIRLALVSIASSVLLAGCSSPQDSASTENRATSDSGDSAAITVTAELRDLIPVIALPASVEAGTRYHVTASLNGKVSVEGDTLRVAGPDGKAQDMKISDLGMDPQVLVQDGYDVSVGTPLVSATSSNFAIVADVSGATLLRFLQTPVSGRGQVEGVSEPFDCALLDSSPTHTPERTFIACQIPPSQRVIAGLSGVLAVYFETVADATVLPLEAVAGTVDSGTVFRKTPDGSEEVRVKLGVISGTSVQVTEGLKPGDEVLIPSPSMLGGQ